MGANRSKSVGWLSAGVCIGMAFGLWIGRHGAARDRQPTQIPTNGAATASAIGLPEAGNAPTPKYQEAHAIDRAPWEGVLRAQAALMDRNPGRRLRAFLAEVDALTAETAPQIERLFVELDAAGVLFDGEEFSIFLQRWGEVDFDGAMRWLDEKRRDKRRPGDREWDMLRLLTGLATVDPAGAQRWLESNPAESDNPSFWTIIVGGLADKDTAAATDLALSKTGFDPRQRAEALGQIVDHIVRKEGINALDMWFAPLVAKVDVETASRVANDLARRALHADVERGRQWLAENSAAPWRPTEAIAAHVHQWAEKDPASAVHWVIGLPAGADGVPFFPGLSQAVTRWMSQSPESVGSWIGQYRSAPFYVPAATAIAEYYLHQGDQETADKWRESIQAP